MRERLAIRFDQWWHSGDPTPNDVCGLLIAIVSFVLIASLGL